MAIGDLKKLLEEARTLLMKDTEWYRTFLDVQPHTYANSVRNVTKELQNEVGQAVYSEHRGTFDKLIKDYVATLYNRIVKTKRNAYRIVEHPGSSATSFIVDIIPMTIGSVGAGRRSGNTLVYDSVGSDPFKRIINVEKRAALKPLLEEVNKLLGTSSTSSTFLDTGHSGLGVAEKQTYEALSEIKSTLDAREDISELARSSGVLAKLKLSSKWVGTSKKTTIEVTDESYKANRSKATREKAFKATTKNALEEILRNTDWGNQKGSDSVIDATIADFNQIAKKAGAKVKNKNKANRASGTASTQINFRKDKVNIRDGGFVKKVTSGDRVQPEFDLSLINLINIRLPPAVRANMMAPALINRTGTFAQSVRVTGVERTPQGFPLLTYTYQRNPYDVFDPVLGSKPWATGRDRDPKVLIDKSIRDAARELAIGRFYTRRA